MRIWIVNHYAYGPNLFPGTRHYSLARQLIRRGHDVMVISTSYYHKACRETRLEPDQAYARESIDGVPFHWLRTPPYKGNSIGRLWNMAVFAGRVWREQGLENEPRPDVILGSSPDLMAAWAADRLAKRFGIPFVLEIRDLWPETFISLGYMTRRHPLVLWLSQLEKKLYRRADRILTLLPGAADYIAQHGGSHDKTVWLPNGIDLEWIPQPEPLEDKPTFIAMYAGSHTDLYGMDTILDAAAILQHRAVDPKGKTIRIKLVGDGREKPRLMKRAQEMGLTNVEFLPPVPKQEVYATMSQADAFLLLQRISSVLQWGISPHKLYDYMACARPTVFSLSTPFNPVEEAGAGVTATPEDPQSMADCIRFLAEQPLSVRQQMGERAREYVVRNNSMEHLAGKLEHILQDVVAARRGEIRPEEQLRNAA